MIIYYSGDGSSYSQPEIMMGEKATLMLTFFTMISKGKTYRKPSPSKRFQNVYDARIAQKGKKRHGRKP